MRRLLIGLALTASLAFGFGTASAAPSAAYCSQLHTTVEAYAAVNADISEPRADWLEGQIAACGGAAGYSAQAQAWLTAEGVSY